MINALTEACSKDQGKQNVNPKNVLAEEEFLSVVELFKLLREWDLEKNRSSYKSFDT